MQDGEDNILKDLCACRPLKSPHVFSSPSRGVRSGPVPCAQQLHSEAVPYPYGTIGDRLQGQTFLHFREVLHLCSFGLRGCCPHPAISGRGVGGEGSAWEIMPGTDLSYRQEDKTQHWFGSEGCKFDEVNLGKCLLHLYLLFRGVCIAAWGLLVPANIVLSITLIRGWHLSDTKYFSLIFNLFLARPYSQCSQNLSAKTQQNRGKKKRKKQARLMPVWLVAGCSVWRLFSISAYTVRTCVCMDGIKYKGGGQALTLWI